MGVVGIIWVIWEQGLKDFGSFFSQKGGGYNTDVIGTYWRDLVVLGGLGGPEKFDF